MDEMLKGLDFVRIGRMVGMAIVVVGVVLAIWAAADSDYLSGSERTRQFFRDVLYWGAIGTLTILAAEVVDRLGARRAS